VEYKAIKLAGELWDCFSLITANQRAYDTDGRIKSHDFTNSQLTCREHINKAIAWVELPFFAAQKTQRIDLLGSVRALRANLEVFVEFCKLGSFV
jgi:hypothetical protein